MAPQPIWWHDLTIIAIARVMLLNLFAIIGLLLAEGAAAQLIDGHTPAWVTVGQACFAFGMLVTEMLSFRILWRTRLVRR